MCNNFKYYVISFLFSSCITEGVNSSVGRPTIGTSSGNVHLGRSEKEIVANEGACSPSSFS